MLELMKISVVIYFLIIVSSCAESINSQQTNTFKDKIPVSSIPDGWVLYPTSNLDDAALQCANYSRNEWRVEQDGNNLKIRLDKLADHQAALPDVIRFRDVEVGTKGYRSVERVSNGWLVGLDVGEFGGGLWWFSSDGKIIKKLSSENIRGFAKISTGIIVLTGLNHLGINKGNLLKITGDENAPKVGNFVDLNATSQAFAIESPDSLLVLTTNSLVRINSSGTAEKLFSTKYEGLYPTSMVVSKSGVIHIGMRHFVSRLTPINKEYQEELFVPSNCTQFKVRDLDCVCTLKER